MSDTVMPRLPECKLVFVAGPVSSGKTHLIRHWVQQHERVLVHDVTADYLGAEYEHIWNSDYKSLALRLKQNPHYFRISYHVNADNAAQDFFWEYACMWQLSAPRYFFVEECANIFNVSYLVDGAENVLRYARHNLLGVVASSQRIADVSKLLTSGARMVVLFYTNEFRDTEAIRERWGKEMADAVTKLRPCIFNDATKELEQAPECVVYLKGSGFKVIALGSKVKTTQTGESEQWHEILAEQPTKQEQQFSPPPSGEREQQLPEDTSEALPQN